MTRVLGGGLSLLNQSSCKDDVQPVSVSLKVESGAGRGHVRVDATLTFKCRSVNVCGGEADVCNGDDPLSLWEAKGTSDNLAGECAAD